MLVKLAGETIRQIGVLRGAEIINTEVIPLPECYPVYRKDYRVWLAEIVSYLRVHHPHLSLLCLRKPS